MTRSIVLRALGALALVTALAPLPAVASQTFMTATMFASSRADRAWVTVYRSEFSGMKREIVASGWMNPRQSFSTTQYSGDHYFFRAQAHKGDKIIADTTVEIDPRRNQRIDLIDNDGSFHWQIPR
jgi:hypothetical protein